jgi:hypothetical protein
MARIISSAGRCSAIPPPAALGDLPDDPYGRMIRGGLARLARDLEQSASD